MTFLYILGGILGFVLLLAVILLFCKVSFFAGVCDKKPEVTLKVAFLTFRLVDGIPEQAEPGTTPKPKSKKKKQKPKKPASPVTREKPTVQELLHLIGNLLSGLTAGVKKHLRVEELRCRVLVASDDAAKTALLYGGVNALLSPLTAFAEAVPKKQKNEKKILVNAECDFLADEPELDARIGLSARVWRLLAIGIRSYKDAIALIEALKAYKNTPAERK